MFKSRYGSACALKKEIIENLSDEVLKIYVDFLFDYKELNIDVYRFALIHRRDNDSNYIMKKINELKKDFCLEKVLRLYEYSKLNPKDTSSLNYMIAKYGEVEGPKKFDEKKIKD